MSVSAIGVDICESKRIGRIVEQHGDRFLKRVFTENEIAYCGKRIDQYSALAARFAAKEALLKALGTGLRDGLNWQDIEILNDQLGKPYFKFSGKTADRLAGRKTFLSLSHTDQNSIAFVIISGDPDD